MYFGELPERMVQRRLDCHKLCDPTSLTVTRSAMAGKLALPPSNNINEHWQPINSVLHFAGLVTCGSNCRFVTPQISVHSICLLEARQSIPVGSAHSEARLVTRREFIVSMCTDRESWWSQRDSEMQHDVDTANPCKLFHFIPDTTAVGNWRVLMEPFVYANIIHPIYNRQMGYNKPSN